MSRVCIQVSVVKHGPVTPGRSIGSHGVCPTFYGRTPIDETHSVRREFACYLYVRADLSLDPFAKNVIRQRLYTGEILHPIPCLSARRIVPQFTGLRNNFAGRPSGVKICMYNFMDEPGPARKSADPRETHNERIFISVRIVLFLLDIGFGPPRRLFPARSSPDYPADALIFVTPERLIKLQFH